MADATWATIADVAALTGKTVTQAVLNQAESIVETLTGAVAEFAADLVSARDQHFLKKAVAYEAAWLADQPDAFTRSDVSSASQDGQAATFKPDALVLAPMARKAILRLSWRGTRTIRPTRPGINDARSVDEVDDSLNWQPLT